MKALLFISLFLVAALATPLQQQLLRDLFTQWKATHKKAYATEYEHKIRFQIFSHNYLEILKFNKEQSDVTLALNHFADLTTEEFGALYTGLMPNKNANNNAKTAKFQALKDLPVSVDWRTKGAVTDVKNQGSCGSCWAFSATGALEGFYFINNQKLVSFSEQQLVDCVTADQGCNGGLPSDAFVYTGGSGIETEADYPYKAVTQNCSFVSSKAIKANAGYANVTANNLTAMKTAIVNQPVSVGIQANQLIFQFYQKGVIKRLCGDKLDHGVLVVGYDTSQGPEAFIVKNSWGGNWGVNGYVYISTDETANKGAGVCGILSMATVPSN
jgi:xylem cysteine proteinase